LRVLKLRKGVNIDLTQELFSDKKNHYCSFTTNKEINMATPPVKFWQCPGCKVELGEFKINWLAGGPPLKQSYKCPVCGTLFFEYTLLNRQPVLLDSSKKPAGMPMSQWVEEEILKMSSETPPPDGFNPKMN
jgi:predicted RNA-binding Zn-ribbon protein involved in translation (DUF1610 family)